MPDLDLSSYLSDDTLKLHGIASPKHPGGRTYEVRSPSALDGLKLRRLMNLTGDNPLQGMTEASAAAFTEFCTDADGQPVDFGVKLLGDAHAQMVDDGVSMDRLDQIVRIVALNFGGGTELAQLVVEAAKGEAEARAKRAAKQTRSTARKTAGSKSSRASTRAQAQRTTPKATRGTGRSSTSPSARAAVS